MREDRLVRGALGVVFLSGALLANPAIADAAIKIKKVDSATATISKSGKLVSKKNGEKLKGFKVYKSVLYENGRKYTGVINKTYFKNGVLATALYKKVYYEKGKPGTGLYKKVYYEKGKPGTGLHKTLYYVKGNLFTGKLNNNQYENGVNKGAYELESPFYLKEYLYTE